MSIWTLAALMVIFLIDIFLSFFWEDSQYQFLRKLAEAIPSFGLFALLGIISNCLMQFIELSEMLIAIFIIDIIIIWLALLTVEQVIKRK